MGVDTTADEMIDQQKNDLDSLARNMMRTTSEWGWDDYNREFQAKYREAMALILRARSLLD